MLGSFLRISPLLQHISVQKSCQSKPTGMGEELCALAGDQYCFDDYQQREHRPFAPAKGLGRSDHVPKCI